MKEKIKSFFTTKDSLFIVILIGVLLVVVAIPTGTFHNKTLKSESMAINSADFEDDGIQTENFNLSQEAYIDQLEEELRGILQNMDGIRTVNVMITLKQGATQICENQGDGLFGQSNEKILTTEYPKVEGVLLMVDCDNLKVSNKDLTEAVCALFDLEAHKVKVLSGKRQ